MTNLHAGCAGFDRPRPRYARRLSFVEFDLRPPAPAAKVLARWREELGENFVFSFAAPQSIYGERDWPLRDATHTQREYDKFAHVARALTPRVILLRTPASIRPNTVAFQRFLELAARMKKLAPLVAWEPQGLWEREAAKAASADLGLLVVADPLRDDVSGEKIVYARLRGLGSDRRYHSGRLTDMMDALEEAEEAFVVFETPTGYSEASRLVSLASGAAVESDDEDEDGEEGEEDEDADEDEDGPAYSSGDEDSDDEDSDDEDSDDEDSDDEDSDDEDDEEKA